ncbi:hypothetical protein ANCCEY_12237 [Ancylostoma ceylanicum]|uniref:Endonuclease/exonuclease/phosphatase domain-containing protein n=1 Tax=Ancylostoma ceylanicum TaxID=53326 RepID=A0A0D6LA48_9BILA|nr:hypothetical protein ANCCEY_12237 [Ancylostoma ceylanicum]
MAQPHEECRPLLLGTWLEREEELLEVVGGPQPPRPIRFALNNSRIASVEPNALITSSNLGYTSITGTMDAGHERSSRSTVVLHVVSLAGIRAIASTQIAEKGAYVSVRVNGLDEHESPFSFGGALYPFKVTWTVSHPGVLQIIHPFGSSISETDDNRPQSIVEYSVPSEFADRLSVTKSGLVQTKYVAGPAAVVVRRTDLSENETSVVPMSILAVHSLDVIILTKLELSTSTPLVHLPVGIRIVLKVVLRDSRGRELSASSNNRISYRPHRFDLTEIVASDVNQTLTITLKSVGETVLKIWDSADPSLNVFVRLSAKEMLYPSTRKPVVSDIVCFTSPLSGAPRWLSNDNHLEWLDVERGFARLTRTGSTHVTVKVAGQKLTTSFSISPAQQLTFATSVPDFISDVEGTSFVFPVNIVANGTTSSHTAVVGTYACVVEHQEVGQVHLDIVRASQMDLTLVAKWSGDSQIRDASVDTIFHTAMRVMESEIQLSDMDQRSATLSIQVPAYQLRYVTASGCSGDIVTVTETRQPPGANVAANKFFVVKDPRWKGSKAIEIGDDIKLFYHGVETKKNGVAIAVDASLENHISSVTRVSDNIIFLRIATAEGFWTVVSVYAPQCGCTEMEKTTFYEELDDVIRSVPKSDYLTIGGDFNGHVGRDKTGFERMHGGRGFGSLNQDGERIIESAEAHDLAIASTFFTKKESQKVTYSSADRQGEMDHVLVWRTALKTVNNVKSIPGEETPPIQLKLRAQRLRWYGHVMRRPSLYPTRQAMEMDVAGKRPRGAPKKRWKDALNVKLAALWTDLSQKCAVKVENSITAQKISVPVRIRIVGQAAKQPTGSSEGVFGKDKVTKKV